MFKEITSAQAKTIIDSEQIYSALEDVFHQAEEYAGGMHWKSIAGKDYLYRTKGRKEGAKSLGARSPKTEAIIANFFRRKEELSTRSAEMQEQIRIQQKINVVHRAGHVPNTVADICIQLDRAGLLDSSITIIGTIAMHAYESMAAVRLPDSIMATADVDRLWNHRSKLSIATTEKIEEAGLLGLLKKADKSFEIKSNQRFRAITAKGYMVDLIRQMPNPPWADEPDRFFQDDLVATDIWNMKWLLGAPRVIQPVIAMDGRVFKIAVPDPRAFVMFKLWLSTDAEDREPGKKLRDAQQAHAVIRLIEDRLPHLAKQWPALKSFPQDVMDRTLQEVQRERCGGG